MKRLFWSGIRSDNETGGGEGALLGEVRPRGRAMNLGFYQCKLCRRWIVIGVGTGAQHQAPPRQEPHDGA